MALQLTVTGDNGLDITYWKISELSSEFEGDKIDFRFTINGYKDAEWRGKNRSAKSLTFHVLTQFNGASAVLYDERDESDGNIPEGKSVGDIKTPAAPEGTNPTDRSATILDNTGGDLRAPLYAWLKTHDATATDGPADNYGNAEQVVDWSSAIDV